MSEQEYQGKELELFAEALNWKSYWGSIIRPFLGPDVLEVGAGIGTNSAVLCPGQAGRYVCLEPDPKLAKRIDCSSGNEKPERRKEVFVGTLSDLPAEERFDSVLYIDVLEHIDNDKEELALAAAQLKSGGSLIVMAPAHQGLFSKFDEAVGHYRRYKKADLKALNPPGTEVVLLNYLDAVGLFASLANKVFLRQPVPTREQIRFWDKFIVPTSRLIDPLALHLVGKSIIAVWRIRNRPETMSRCCGAME